MVKITLKPRVKELLFRNEDANTHFDVFSYGGTTVPEKQIGNLYIMGHAKFDAEDLGYVVSLIGSLAKREYYSEGSVKNQDPKVAFEKTLNKLNEVLHDFFSTKELSLNIGIMAIAGDSLYLSKLGKFKVGLARAGEYIDVLNNLTLFQKNSDSEQKFSNIISGSLHSGDKLFAYIPSRTLSAREKILKPLLVNEGQDAFTDQVAVLAKSSSVFSCCGIHVSLEEIKEIPIENVRNIQAHAVLTSAPPLAQSVEQLLETAPKPIPSEPINIRPTRIIASELSVEKKSNFFSTLLSGIGNIRHFNKLSSSAKIKLFLIVALIIITPLVFLTNFRAKQDDLPTKNLIAKTVKNVELAKELATKSDSRGARALLYSSLDSLKELEGPRIDGVKKQLFEAIDAIDRVSAISPKLADEKSTSEMLSVWNFRSSAPAVNILTDSKDTVWYGDNLYSVGNGVIVKFAGAISGKKNSTTWANGIPDDTKAIVADGYLYALTSSGRLLKYFKGKEDSTKSLEISPVSGIATTGSEESLIYMVNNEFKRIYGISKSNGSVEITYKIDSLPEIKEISLNESGNLFFSDGIMVWTIEVQP